MFTGIVEELGEVAGVEDLGDAARITISCPRVAAESGRGDSVAVNGVCLTVTARTGTAFTADVMAETLRRSSLGMLIPGSPVNLERPLRLDGRLGGHLVQGHVDGAGTLLSRTPGQHWDVLRIAVPPALARYLVDKGSIAVDGVSLTVSATGTGDAGGGPWFEVSLIPTTLELTTLGRAQPGSIVNLEVDVIAKYVERLTTGDGPAPGSGGRAAGAGTGREARAQS
jgi:riboflavin synthase